MTGRAALVGRTVADVSRRAKRIVFTLNDGGRFFAHLGMTGQLLFGEVGRERVKHTHVAITFDTGELHQVDPRRFGGPDLARPRCWRRKRLAPNLWA